MDEFNASIDAKIGNYRRGVLFNDIKPDLISFTAFDNTTKDEDTVFPYADEPVNAPLHEQNDTYFEELDNYIDCHVVVPGSDGVTGVLAKVKNRKRDSAGNLIGSANSNPILDSRVYDLEFPDRKIESYSTNLIAENLFAQVDEYGYDTGRLFLIELIQWLQFLKRTVPLLLEVVQLGQLSLLKAGTS